MCISRNFHQYYIFAFFTLFQIAWCNSLSEMKGDQYLSILSGGMFLISNHFIFAKAIPTSFTGNKGEKTAAWPSISDPSSGKDSLFSTNTSSIINYDGKNRVERNRGMRLETDKERQRLALLKQIKNLDSLKCFPKVLCGLSIDSTKNSKVDSSFFVRSYIQLMRSANPEDDSSEETKPSSDKTKDALSLFLMKSGLLKNPNKMSQSASSSEESPSSDETEFYRKSPLEKKNDAIKTMLSKRKLTSKNGESYTNDDPYMLLPMLHVNSEGSPMFRQPEDEDEPQSITSQIGSLVQSWVPWVSLSFTRDSFEKDPFFKGGSQHASKKSKDKWQKDLDKLAMLMRLRDAEIKGKKARAKGRVPKAQDTNEKSIMDEEIQVYSTAVEIGKKLKDTRQCDYLYNGCPVPYEEIIKIIATVRQDLKQSDETTESLSKEILDFQKTTKKPSTALTKDKQKQTNKQPMTKISHTLPNGEKVEINVQLSAKDEHSELEIESPHGESDYVVKDEPVEGLISVQEQPEGDEPAISASYELDEDKYDGDHRKPLPAVIFNKVGMKKTTTKRPSTKYVISNRRTTPTPPTTTTTKKSKPSSTRRPSTKRPVTVTRRTKRPTTISPPKEIISLKSSTQLFIASQSATTKKPSKFAQGTNKNVALIDIESNLSSTTSKGSNKNRPTKEPITKIVGSTSSSAFGSNSGKRKKQTVKMTTTSTTTTEKQMVDTEFYPDQNIVIEIDKSVENNSGEDDTRPMVFQTTTTSTPRTTTLPALAIFTKSYMDEVISQMYKARPKSPPTVPPIPHAYSISKKRKPVTNNNHRRKPPLSHDSYVTSVEGSGEATHPFSTIELGPGTLAVEQSHFADLQVALASEPTVGESSVDGANEKKKITYKNPKRPYLVLMSNSKKRPGSSTYTNDSHYSIMKNVTSWNEHMDGNPPLVISPGTAEYSQWSPSSF